MFIYRVVEAFEKANVRYAIVGGFAVALHGAVRGTIDLDLVLNLRLNDFEKAEKVLQSLGMKSRLPITAKELIDFREEYIRNRNLIAWNFQNPKQPQETVDIIITHDLGDMKTVSIKAAGRTLKVVSIDDLIKMKKQSGRPQDLEDIKSLKELKK
jgi:hypothetical protein